jgi:hypothetical protein
LLCLSKPKSDSKPRDDGALSETWTDDSHIIATILAQKNPAPEVIVEVLVVEALNCEIEDEDPVRLNDGQIACVGRFIQDLHLSTKYRH